MTHLLAEPLLWRHNDVVAGQRSFPYWYGHNCLDLIAEQLARLAPDRLIIISDSHVAQLHGSALLAALKDVAPADLIAAQHGEQTKRLGMVSALAEHAIQLGATRRTGIVAFGGGVVGNVAGLLAGLLFRGVRLIHIPTTVIAAMDSVISLKQTVNSDHGKNHIGVYHQPTMVLTDLALLGTLAIEQARSGWCEFVKNCLAIRPESIGPLRQVMTSGDLLAPSALTWLLEESLAAKRAVMFDDTEERRRGLVLEYGHTVGHAIELADLQRRGAEGISHGEAVGLGMLAAATISANRGWLSVDDVRLHRELLAALGVPLSMPHGLDQQTVAALVAKDNKRGLLPGEHAAFVLLRRLGEPAGEPMLPLTGVSGDEVHAALKELRNDRR